MGDSRLSPETIRRLVRQALSEDKACQDLTTRLTIHEGLGGEGVIIAKDNGILCGLELARCVFKQLNPRITVKTLHKDGWSFRQDDVVAVLRGDIRGILSAERVALNFLSLLSGVATLTRKFVDRVGRKVKIMDTRKTTPTLRELEKYAVRIGGGFSYRRSLCDAILIKDNHLKAGRYSYKGLLDKAKIRRLFKRLQKNTSLPVEIEVENLKEFGEIIQYKPYIVMLDNFSVKDLKTAVRLRNQHFATVKLEASGGINLANVKRIAQTGVDFISIGMLTHSPQAVDFSLEIIK